MARQMATFWSAFRSPPRNPDDALFAEPLPDELTVRLRVGAGQAIEFRQCDRLDYGVLLLRPQF